MTFTSAHALLIGVGTYQHTPQLNVPITTRDAHAVGAVLRDPDACGYPGMQVTVLSDSAATRNGILTSLDTLATLGEDATIFLCYSGHGATSVDGNYYLTTHDTRIEGGRVATGSGVSEQELLDRLRKIKAKRLLTIFNACHSGEVSPVLSPTEEPVTGTQLPEKTAAALLATGSGRVIITACREHQVSFIGSSELTLFGQALVDGLQGKGDYLANRNGFISVFDLYSHLYDTLQTWVPQRIPADARQKYGDTQEPELTVLKGVGPFAVALYRGARTLGGFSAPDKPDIDVGLREVDEKRSQRLLGQILASGPFAGATVTTQQSGGINLGIGTQIGQMGDIVAGDKIGGDKVYGDKINITTLPPDLAKLLAGIALSQTVSMVFVDIMRMLYVASSENAYQANITRYPEFLGIAEQHFSDFRQRLARYYLVMDNHLHMQINFIENSLSWIILRLKSNPTSPSRNNRYFQKAKEISKIIEDFCRNAAHEYYLQQYNLIGEINRNYISHLEKRVSTITPNNIFSLRQRLQSEVLARNPQIDRPILSIADDMYQSFAMLYFLIDYSLLQYIDV